MVAVLPAGGRRRRPSNPNGRRSQKSEHDSARAIASATTPSLGPEADGGRCEQEVGRQKPTHMPRHDPVRRPSGLRTTPLAGTQQHKSLLWMHTHNLSLAEGTDGSQASHVTSHTPRGPTLVDAYAHAPTRRDAAQSAQSVTSPSDTAQSVTSPSDAARAGAVRGGACTAG